MAKKYIEDKTIFYSGLVYFLMMCIFIAVRILNSYQVLGDPSTDLNSYIFTLIVQIGIMLLLPLLFFKKLSNKSYSKLFNDFGFKKVSLKSIVYALLLGVLAYILVLFITTFWSGLMQLLGYPNVSSSGSYNTDGNAWLSCLLGIFFIGVLPGFCEEFAHRGMILSSLRSNGVWRAILFTALLFALMHLSFSKVGYAFVIGVLLGMVTVVSRSIFPAMIIHFTNNALSTYLGYSIANGWWGSDFLNSIFNYLESSNIFTTFLISFLIIALVLILIIMILARLYNEGKRKQFAEFKKNMRVSLPNEEMRADFDKLSNEAVFKLFRETMALQTKQNLEKAKINETQLAEILSTRSPLSLMIEDSIVPEKKPNSLDYLFYYCSIFLGSVVTIITFLWGVV